MIDSYWTRRMVVPLVLHNHSGYMLYILNYLIYSPFSVDMVLTLHLTWSHLFTSLVIRSPCVTIFSLSFLSSSPVVLRSCLQGWWIITWPHFYLHIWLLFLSNFSFHYSLRPKRGISEQNGTFNHSSWGVLTKIILNSRTALIQWKSWSQIDRVE